jgi:hypothetical protein
LRRPRSSRGQQSFDDLAVQMVGNHHAHRIDVGCVSDRAPVVAGPLIAVALGGVVGHRGIGVGDRHQSHIRAIDSEQCCGGAVSGGMCTPGQSPADDGDADWL